MKQSNIQPRPKADLVSNRDGYIGKRQRQKGTDRYIQKHPETKTVNRDRLNLNTYRDNWRYKEANSQTEFRK